MMQTQQKLQYSANIVQQKNLQTKPFGFLANIGGRDTSK